MYAQILWLKYKSSERALHITETADTLQGYYDEAEKALDEAKTAIEKDIIR